ncbi:MAG: MOSC domain-containing protein [Gemmatimonadota bacterium]
MTLPRILSVNVGGIREVEWNGRLVTTGIWKSPVAGRVAIHGENFDGDDQADRTVHGGLHKAIYAYAVEDYAYWRDAEEFSIEHGLFGENLTVEGIDLSRAVVGERWHVGSAVLEIAQPRFPCFKLGIRVGDNGFPKRFQQALRPGAYLRVITEGNVGTGDTIRVTDGPPGGVTMRSLVEVRNQRPAS